MQEVQTSDRLVAEAQRIETAYARRQRLRKYSYASMGHTFGQQEQERNTLALLKRQGCEQLAEKTILEVGCGAGSWIQQMIRWGAAPERITGIDVRADALARARATVPAAVRLEQCNAAALPFASASFDIVLQSTVFTSVLDRQIRREIAAEMMRVLRPDGVIIWYDFSVDNPQNPDVAGVSRREIMELFAGCRLDLRRVTLVPPVLRWLAPKSWLLAYALSQIPPFCTHYMGAITKGAPPAS